VIDISKMAIVLAP